MLGGMFSSPECDSHGFGSLTETQNFFQHRDTLEQGCPESLAGANQKNEVEQTCDVTKQGLENIGREVSVAREY